MGLMASWKEPIELQWCVIFVNQSSREIISKIKCQKVPKNIVSDEHQPKFSVKAHERLGNPAPNFIRRKGQDGEVLPGWKKASLSLSMLWFSTVRKHQKYPVGYLKPRWWGPRSWVSDSVQLGWGPRICISKNFPGPVDASCPRIILLRTTVLYTV